jgi:hypothetical protein
MDTQVTTRTKSEGGDWGCENVINSLASFFYTRIEEERN